MKNPIKPNFKTEIIPILFIILSIILSFYFYAHFPERVPTHWNAHGEINGWSGRGFGAFFFPLLNLGIYLLMLFIPAVDPKKKNYDQFKNIYHIIKGALIVFMTAIYFAASLSALGYPLKINLIVPIGVGLLFIIIGYYLGRIKQNWFIGIRTPWTLSSEIVWQKTHKFGAKIFVLAGILFFLVAIFPDWFLAFMLLLIAMILSIIVYSYLIYLKEK